MTKKILVVYETASDVELETGNLFNSPSDYLFRNFMRAAGLAESDCDFMPLFNEYVPNTFGLFGTQKEGVPYLRPWRKGKYLLHKHYHHLTTAWERIAKHNCNLVLALGDLPIWALTSEASVKSGRGRIYPGNAKISHKKILPTYGPLQVIRDWTLRPVIFADLKKAVRQAEFPEIIWPTRYLHIEPSLVDLETFFNDYILPAPKLTCDIENTREFITCVGIGTGPDRAIVIPFHSKTKASGSYWDDPKEELAAWRWLERVLALPKLIIGQNFQHDMTYLWQHMGIGVHGTIEDTMLMQHSNQIEMLKGLGFLGSVFTDERSWKGMHQTPTAEKSAKRGDGDE